MGDSAYPDVHIDRKSALRVGPASSRFRLWLTRAERIGGGSWQDSFDPREVCLHLFDEHLVLRGFQCASVRDVGRPERLLMVLSGGAAGAPGLRPREVVIAGIVPSDVDEVRVGAGSMTARVAAREGRFFSLHNSKSVHLTF